MLIGEVQQHLTDQVWVDSVAAARDATRHLIERGARRIAVIGAPSPGSESATSELRLQGFRDAMAEAGIAVDESLIPPCPRWTTAAGDDVMSAMLDRDGTEPDALPDAVFAFTDSMALGAIGAMWRRGIRVPDDVLVCGFDDIDESAHLVPPLTTVGFDRAEFAGAALEMLVDRFTDRVTPPRLVTVPHRVVIRASTTR